MAVASPREVLEFWFPDDQARANALWWGKSAELDAEIRERFAETRAAAKAGELDHWTGDAEGRLALIVVLDQLSRNLFRGDAETHAADDKALAIALEGIERGDDQAVPPRERLFYYLPLEHAEDLSMQDRCVELVRRLAVDLAAASGGTQSFDGYVDFAIRHRDIVARFGRFPHRNALLGRESTPEEIEFLKQPGSGF